MQFLSKDVALELEKKFRRQIAESDSPKFVLYYESGTRDYATAANAIAHAAGEFSEATVLYLFSIRCGWDDHSPVDERWQRYKGWRAARDESRQLYDAPCHQFESSEVAQLSKTIEFALELGWDAIVTTKPGRQLLFLSHDDRLEIYRGFDGRSLARQLTNLGYWRSAEVMP